MVQGSQTELVKRSALWRKHLSLGASMANHHGWEVAEGFTSPNEEADHVGKMVGLGDVSWLGKFDLKGKSEKLKSQILDSNSFWQLAEGHSLITCEPQDSEKVQGELEELATSSDCLHLTDITSVYCALMIAGPKSRDVLNKLTELDVSGLVMSNPSCAQTGLAHVHSIVLREDLGGLLAFRLFITRDYGEYIWDAVMHAGQEVGIMPFGLEAQRFLK